MTYVPRVALVMVIALLFDMLLGDPPNRFHPTAWMGSLIGVLKRFRPYGNRLAEFMYGLFIVCIGCGLAAGAGWMILVLTSSLPAWSGLLIEALLLSLTISLRGLDRAAGEVQTALEKHNLPEGRRLLAWHLVSRETAQLNESQVAAAAIESVAENASDGIIAPLFFFALGGLPAVFAYRFANTADSMLGYRDPEREWLGKIPARFDDVLNFIPARLAGLFIVLSAPFCGASLGRAWNVMWREAHRTASPNAGVPMSAMAGALGVELEKVGHYQLGQGLRFPNTHGLLRARRLLYVSVWMAALVFLLWSRYVRSG
ncbi:MAG: cobalamin biosynthesis protein CobD [Anaerolineales bacterium]|nr:cobalamin biosynthesis protein CobD [Anaerolineales bacterium]